ncbi:MAG: tRNA adenosine(34) deaminase TadA [Clostridia bacterium]
MIISEKEKEKHELFMKEAYLQAEKAQLMGEVPVGAVVVYEDKIILRTHNLVEINSDPTAHAEILALKESGKSLGANKLTEIQLYVTLEPCAMCAGAILQARIQRLIFGAYDDKLGAVGSLYDVIRNPAYNTDIEVIGGILQNECSALLKSFFSKKR